GPPRPSGHGRRCRPVLAAVGAKAHASKAPRSPPRIRGAWPQGPSPGHHRVGYHECREQADGPRRGTMALRGRWHCRVRAAMIARMRPLAWNALATIAAFAVAAQSVSPLRAQSRLTAEGLWQLRRVGEPALRP